MKTCVVYEILWERLEYGGLSKSAGSTVHSTLEKALEYKKRREANRSAGWPNDDPFSNRGSQPRAKAVGKAEHARVLAEEAGR